MAYQVQSSGRVSTQGLLGQVLGLTALGLCVTALAVYLFPNLPFGFSVAGMIGGFILLFAINATRQNAPLSLMLFYGFAFLEGLGITPVITNYTHMAGGSDIVFNAALTTGLGMFAMGAIVYATGLDLRRFQGILMLALLGLVLVGIVSLFVHFLSPTIYSWLTLVIFTGFVLIDFARIRAGGDGLSAVQIALSLYLDAINIFMALLRIFGGRGGRD